jgi:hypothetical protein
MPRLCALLLSGAQGKPSQCNKSMSACWWIGRHGRLQGHGKCTKLLVELSSSVYILGILPMYSDISQQWQPITGGCSGCQ